MLHFTSSESKALESCREGDPSHLAENTVDPARSREWRLGSAAQAGAKLGKAIGRQTHKGEALEGVTELAILGQ